MFIACVKNCSMQKKGIGKLPNCVKSFLKDEDIPYLSSLNLRLL
jgi:hypothetical protein